MEHSVDLRATPSEFRWLKDNFPTTVKITGMNTARIQNPDLVLDCLYHEVRESFGLEAIPWRKLMLKVKTAKTSIEPSSETVDMCEFVPATSIVDMRWPFVDDDLAFEDLEEF